jgi:hypothetical protein
MLNQGKSSKVLTAACKGWSRLLTFPRGAVSQETRYQARKGLTTGKTTEFWRDKWRFLCWIDKARR